MKKISSEKRADEFCKITEQIGMFSVDSFRKIAVRNHFHDLLGQQEVIVNQHSGIYPDLRYVDFLQSEKGTNAITI